MDLFNYDIAALGSVCFVAAAAALGIAAVLTRPLGQPGSAVSDSGGAAPGELSLLVRHGQITDASPEARQVIGCRDRDLGDWDRIRSALAHRFSDCPVTAPRAGTLRISADGADDPGVMEITATDDAVRLRVMEAAIPSAGHLHLMHSALARLRQFEAVFERAPFPIWVNETDRDAILTNAAFRALGLETGLGPARLLDSGLPPPGTDVARTTRVEVANPSGTTSGARWFDVTVTKLEGAQLNYAIDMTPVVKAEIAQREFVQTLTKTFALLNMGLAIFDQTRRLTLFNPALIELTAMAPEFLSGRPDLASFFDALRERQVMPEPKNYIGWREAIGDVAARAADGRFEETWSLPTGQTYRVTGRPYPNGAIAFLFEDITSEIEMSRRFNQHIQLAQSVLDSLDEAVVVFSRQGRVLTANDAYLSLWDIGSGGGLTDVTVHEATRQWEAVAGPDRTWGELRDYAVALGPRCEWTSDVRFRDGRVMACRFTPLADGATLAGFRQLTAPVSRSVVSDATASAG
ncbi:PAS-domain containing protein [Oceanicola sp. 22II-s10i]|uniref:PAS-domain containing protein n=1 Tax=Oceanicola sp. 22II-s10i TaxID=1317116 RepID=UPI00159598A7|nr:PAS-domain containing protein [Oceanicola sp. 22II-s10i]